MTKRLLLLGGGHAHLETLAALAAIRARGHDVTVVAPSPHHYYSGMGPGMLGGTFTPEEIRFDTEAAVTDRGARFVRGLAVAIDPFEKTVLLESGEQLGYDVLSANVGSFVKRPFETAPGADVFPVKPIESLLTLRQAILDRCRNTALHISVAGGGPSSAEVAGNILQLINEARGKRPVITIHARRRFLESFPDKIRTGVAGRLCQRDIGLMEDNAMVRAEKNAVALASGARQHADIIVDATGVRPSTLFADSHLPTGPDGGLLVNQYLQCTAHPDIFGGGDCIHFEPEPLTKVGVYAVRQNAVLRDNLVARLEGSPLSPFQPGGSYLLIFNLGEGTGYLHKNGFTTSGRLAFRIKTFIDSRFMKKYQSLFSSK
ncbi:NAD(P)/FAD-dependent oxidoreductase [Desulfoluna spongiiphila]|uniref:NAD(P)/FAD-dependent oxidoreductase n=1 Tax=Desulfoluna spongiiphila TaxID=419481 RepID=UPI001254C422|nr:FAD-dependent oxidoreductase [Desulfoluna spongiiphila]VVS90751.1 fad-dependent pyridine nucleotide reductase signature [Desulfoluna spongiiphila]